MVDWHLPLPVDPTACNVELTGEHVVGSVRLWLGILAGGLLDITSKVFECSIIWHVISVKIVWSVCLSEEVSLLYCNILFLRGQSTSHEELL